MVLVTGFKAKIDRITKGAIKTTLLPLKMTLINTLTVKIHRMTTGVINKTMQLLNMILRTSFITKKRECILTRSFASRFTTV